MSAEFGFYRVHGVVLRSEIALPELAPAPAMRADATIRIGPAPAPAGATAIAQGVMVDATRFWMDVPGTARLLVRAGDAITVEPAAGADGAAVRAFLLGSALGALLLQRGVLPLHASAVVIGGRAVAFLGTSGAGKSTIALHLADRGHEPLSDDLCALAAVGQGPLVHPGPRRIKLWPGSLHATGREAAGLDRVMPSLDKYQIAMEGAAREAVPLRAAVILDRGTATAVSGLSGVAAVQAVMANTFRGSLIAPMGRTRAHWEQCLALCGAVPVLRLTRPWDLGGLDAVSDAIEDWLQTD